MKLLIIQFLILSIVRAEDVPEWAMTPQFRNQNSLSAEELKVPTGPDFIDVSVNESSKIESIDLQLKDGEDIPPRIALLVDSSGSMGQLVEDNKTRMYILKKVLAKFMIEQWQMKSYMGLYAFGSRKRNDCSDTYRLIDYGPSNINNVLRNVNLMLPIGRTPLYKTVENAFNSIRDYNGPKRIIIFSDGKDTCGGDPCKLAETLNIDPEVDVKIYIIGIGYDPKTEDYRGVECLDAFATTANSEDELLEAFANVINQANDSHNLKVISPEPKSQVMLYRIENGERVFHRSFTAMWGIRVPPGEYEAVVMLNPAYKFPRFTVSSLQRTVLRVEGTGTVKVDFLKELMNVELLNKDGKVIHKLRSDKPYLANTGKYKLRLYRKPYYDLIMPEFLVVPRGEHELKVSQAGAAQLNYKDNVGYYIYDQNDELVGKYLTNMPVVLRTGTYRFYLNANCEQIVELNTTDRVIEKECE